MHDLSHLGPKKVFIFGDGSFFITETVVWGVIVALVIGILACWSASKLQRVPKGKQVIAEFVVEKAYSMVQSVMGVKLGTVFAPYIESAGTVWIPSGNVGSELYVRTGDHNIFPDPGDRSQVHGCRRQAEAYVLSISVYDHNQLDRDVLDAAFAGSATVR